MALRQALTDAAAVAQLFAIWERNVDTVRAISSRQIGQHRAAWSLQIS